MKTQTGPEHPTATKQAEDLPAWMTIPQVSKHHGIDDSTTRGQLTKGLLKAHRIGPRLVRVERESVLSLGRRIGGAVSRPMGNPIKTLSKLTYLKDLRDWKMKPGTFRVLVTVFVIVALCPAWCRASGPWRPAHHRPPPR
jgi:hypothetical protein